MCGYTENCKTPVGNIVIKSNGKAVTDIFIGSPKKENPDKFTEKAACELKMYFSGDLKRFSFPIELNGTDFQKRVWHLLIEIPYGETVSYGDIAEMLGGKRYSRAVGGAVNKNPILIAVPCHRVLGSDGSLTGFACGLSVKKYLLDIEGKNNDI